MGSGSRSIGLAILVAGCGPDLARQTFAERCGEVGPIQLLALAADETAQADWNRDNAPLVTVVQHEDRWLIGVRQFDAPIGPDTWIVGEDPPEVVSSRVVSVDECGGDPRVVARGAAIIRPPRGTEPWIACSEDGRIVVFDPAVEGSGVTHEDLRCTEDVVEGDFVTTTQVEGEAPWLVRVTLDADGSRQTRELTRTPHYPRYLTAPEAPGQVFVVDETDSLLLVDARDGTTEGLRDGVSGFYVSDDARFIEWSTNADALHSGGTWYLWDRATGEEHALSVDGETTVKSYGFHNGVLSYFIDVGPSEYAQRITWLDTGDTQALDGLWDFRGRFDNVSVLSTLPGVVVLDHASGTSRRVFDRSLFGAWATEDAVQGVVHVGDPLGNHSYVVEFAAPDFEPRIVVDDVWHPMHLADGRWLTVRGTDRSTPVLHGTLVAIDDVGAVTVLDHDVAATLHEYNGGNRRHGPPPEVTDTIVYGVRDDDGERTGVWLATLAE